MSGKGSDMVGKPVVVVLTRYRPHALLLLVLSLLWGGVALLAPHPDSLVTRLPPWLALAAAISLVVSGAIGLVGSFWRSGKVEVGLGLEQAAMLIGAGGLILSGYALLRFGESSTPTAVFVGFWVVANLWRAAQIRQDMRGIRRKDG